ncbi:putative glycerol-1-phosphate prenyltransferase [Arcicella aurantiaca]|uniref:Geranylgeranylglyceryl phosphate synthase n=1 Tax=Arcicella aurantiaca TaxID=591202 RepID=A0A316DYR2_9BACT|nr:geranylgeranylglyceryl/heptaprenylglyceryl phosphate synthase [Arcicella aurantiaca]PWK22379.1 putative glycerol-1-phosphate prenyltransferase [Arcicella aurantiaca]
MLSNVLSNILQLQQTGKKGFCVLIDPDNIKWEDFPNYIQLCIEAEVSFLFIGGSLITSDSSFRIISLLKESCNIPIVLFPGNSLHITSNADAILFLSLISGRNPDFLIGQHVIAAPILKKSKLEVIPTAYILVDGGRVTTVSYISNTNPIPSDKSSIVACTAMAGEMLGQKLIFMDSGSGAINTVPTQVIHEVRKVTEVPILVGGGIDSPAKALAILAAGANLVVIGNAIEKNVHLITEIGASIKQFNEQ